MRSLLYWIARMIVGAATFSAIFAFLGGAPGNVLISAAISWLVALFIGMALSAPYYLAPPGTSMGWSLSLPIVFWIILFAFIVVGWAGRLVLSGAWALIGLLWRPAAPGPTGVPGSGVAPAVNGGPAGASWLRDPTGRHLRRYWDGQAWTPHVADGAATAIDPL
jgi:hypothetical protein